MKDWKEKILQSDAGLARPEIAEALIETVGAGALVPSSLVGSPPQESRSPRLPKEEDE